jgi:hypothetical protein
MPELGIGTSAHAEKKLAEAGYGGEPIVVMVPTELTASVRSA